MSRAEADSPNPFIRYRWLLDSYRSAIGRGLSAAFRGRLIDFLPREGLRGPRRNPGCCGHVTEDDLGVGSGVILHLKRDGRRDVRPVKTVAVTHFVSRVAK